jgi:uncharacterized protein (DUF1684 family)
VLALMLAVHLAAGSDYEQEIRRWRVERERKLRADGGWLTLIGLFWLQEGENPVGAAGAARVRLPDGLPQRAGVIGKRGTRITWRPDAGPARDLKTDKSGNPDVIQIGRVRLTIIERGRSFGVRMKDNESEARRSFRGLDWFPVRPDWRVKARFVPAPKMILFDAQAGDKQEMQSPGYVAWEWEGRQLRLTPVLEENQLFFVFRDTTAGKTSYAAARFLYSDLAKDGFVLMDFNKAYNPPCVFTPYATCPLPPPENRLPVPVEAGEKMYKGH